MNGVDFRAALRDRRRVYGTCVLSPGPMWPPVVARAGLDFVFIDTEHNALGRQTVSWMCRAYGAAGLATIVRIPAPDPYQASMALDGGADAVLAPYIETPEQVRALRGAVRLRPLKGERMERGLDDAAALGPETSRYLEERNAGRSLLINIESVPGIERLDEILAAGGVDGVIVGPHDLTVNLGVPEQYHHPRFEEAVRRILETCVGRGVSMGVHAFWNSIPQQIEWAKAGANVILHSADLLLFHRALCGDLVQLKRALGDEAADDGSAAPV